MPHHLRVLLLVLLLLRHTAAAGRHAFCFFPALLVSRLCSPFSFACSAVLNTCPVTLYVQVEHGMDASVAIEPIVGGALIGMTTMMCFLSLMTAVYWGQMSG